MGKVKDLSGLRFNNLTVIKLAYINKRAYWLCQCDCGNQKIMCSHDLGHTKSCGCKKYGQSKKHGLKNTKLYKVWKGFKQRCYNSNNPGYKNYGGRGIKVCEEWLNDFQAFYDWAMENGYKEGLSIDRIDNNGNYEPSNCRWTNRQVQNDNRRNVIHLSYNDETHNIAEWSRILGISKKTIQGRYKRGLSIDKILYRGKLKRGVK